VGKKKKSQREIIVSCLSSGIHSLIFLCFLTAWSVVTEVNTQTVKLCYNIAQKKWSSVNIMENCNF